jgi:hypothetical protein
MVCFRALLQLRLAWLGFLSPLIEPDERNRGDVAASSHCPARTDYDCPPLGLVTPEFHCRAPR